MDAPSNAIPGRNNYTINRRPSAMASVSLASNNIPPIAPQTQQTNDRSALLGSICNFNKSKLRKVTNENH